jgi:redox-sensitive bicupin YhaK (pirin superfamily)
MGHQETVSTDEVQIMSAGTGVLHSEFNPSETEAANTLQIWVLPDKKGHTPRYDQKSFSPDERKNQLQVLVAPDKNANNLWLNQDTYFSRCDLDMEKSLSYKIHNSNNGVYIFLLQGKVKVGEDILASRDAIGIWDANSVEIASLEESSLLFIEVPMN